MQVQYVVGFLFSSYSHVALIRKNRPQWQAGKLNGIGGKIEANESALDAMVREFEEETGAHVSAENWQLLGKYIGNNSLVFAFAAYMQDDIALATKTDEEVGWESIADLDWKECAHNLQFMIPFALSESAKNSEFYLVAKDLPFDVVIRGQENVD